MSNTDTREKCKMLKASLPTRRGTIPPRRRGTNINQRELVDKLTLTRENQKKLADELTLALVGSISSQTSVQNFKHKVRNIQTRHVEQAEAKKNSQIRKSIQEGAGSLRKSCKLAEKHAKKDARKNHTKPRIYPIRSQFNKRMNTVHRKLRRLTELNTQILHRTEANTAVIKAAINEAYSTYFKGWEGGGPVSAKPSNRVKYLVVLLVTLSVTFFVLFQMVATGKLSQSESEDIQEVVSSHNIQLPPGVTTVGPALLPLPLLLTYAIFFQHKAKSIGGAVPAGVIGAVATTVKNSDVVNPAGLRELLRLSSALGPAWYLKP
jgi:hypothetical protein